MAERSVTDWHVDLDLERRVLGAVLTFPLTAECRDLQLTGDAFSLPAHRLIWEACEAVQDDGAEPNVVTVVAQLRATQTLDEVGGPAYLARCMDGVPRPDSGSLLWQISRLEELLTTRVLAIESDRFHARITTDRTALEDGTVEAYIEKVTAARETRRLRPWLDTTAQWQAMAEDVKQRTTGGIPLGLYDVDAAIDGIAPGEVCGLMARPGIGKTVLLCNQARTMGAFGFGHVFFSLEMPGAQITRRLTQAEYRLSKHELDHRIRRGELDETLYHERFGHLTLVDQGGLSVVEMSRRLKQLERGKYAHEPIRAVTVDHVGLIGGDERLSTYDRVSKQVREIKELAKRHAVAVILAIQVNRDSGGDGSKELHLGSARDSGVVEEAMDYLIGVRRFDRSEAIPSHEREHYRDALFMKVIKSRHGTPGEEYAVRFDHTLDVQAAKDLTVPASIASAKVANFGGRR